MNKKGLFIFVATLLVGFSLVHFSSSTSADSDTVMVPQDIVNKPRTNYQVPENGPNAKLLTREEIESKRNARPGAQHIITELLPWGEALAKYDSGVRDHFVDPKRKVWVVQDYYPDGYHTKGGFMEKCLKTGFYDAETGETWGARYTTVEKSPTPKS
jgi:hypothetical protein